MQNNIRNQILPWPYRGLCHLKLRPAAQTLIQYDGTFDHRRNRNTVFKCNCATMLLIKYFMFLLIILEAWGTEAISFTWISSLFFSQNSQVFPMVEKHLICMLYTPAPGCATRADSVLRINKLKVYEETTVHTCRISLVLKVNMFIHSLIMPAFCASNHTNLSEKTQITSLFLLSGFTFTFFSSIFSLLPPAGDHMITCMCL